MKYIVNNKKSYILIIIILIVFLIILFNEFNDNFANTLPISGEIIQTIENGTVYKDNVINLSSILPFKNIITTTPTPKLVLSENVFREQKILFDINKINNILNIKTNDDINLLLVNGSFRLRVNLPFINPQINGLNGKNNVFSENNGISSNYFYLGILKLDSNCKVCPIIESECFNKYVDNKDCTNKILIKNINNSDRLVLIPAIYALDNKLPFNNINFTIINQNGFLYLKNIDTGYLPKLYLIDDSPLINAVIINDNNSNISKIIGGINNTVCNQAQQSINLNLPTINISCLIKQNTNYLLTTNDINNSSPISINIKNDSTINININKYDLNGNLNNKLVLSTCKNNVDKCEYMEKYTIQNFGPLYLNMVCLDDLNSSNLNFTVELINK
jgi:hypothetical protein